MDRVPRFELQSSADEDEKALGIIFVHSPDTASCGEFSSEVLIGLWKWTFTIGIRRKK